MSCAEYAIRYSLDGSLHIGTLVDNIKFEITIDPSTAKEIAQNIINETCKHPERCRKPDFEQIDGKLIPINT